MWLLSAIYCKLYILDTSFHPYLINVWFPGQFHSVSLSVANDAVRLISTLIEEMQRKFGENAIWVYEVLRYAVSCRLPGCLVVYHGAG